MVRKSVLILILLVIIGGLLTMACHPPRTAHCSQGFWKNRGHKLFGPYDRTDLYEKGPGSEAIRDARTAELNWQFWWADDYCLE